MVSGAGSRGFDPREGLEWAQLIWVVVPLLASHSWDMGFFWSGRLGWPLSPSRCRRDKGMGSGGQVKGNDCPLPSHPHMFEAV